jgi:hypothetical protein
LEQLRFLEGRSRSRQTRPLRGAHLAWAHFYFLNAP